MLQRRQRRPLFLLLHTSDPHQIPVLLPRSFGVEIPLIYTIFTIKNMFAGWVPYGTALARVFYGIGMIRLLHNISFTAITRSINNIDYLDGDLSDGNTFWNLRPSSAGGGGGHP